MTPAPHDRLCPHLTLALACQCPLIAQVRADETREHVLRADLLRAHADQLADENERLEAEVLDLLGVPMPDEGQR